MPAFATMAGPMGYLKTFGPRADPATALTWGLTILSILVVATITTLVLAGVLVRRRRGEVVSLTDEPAVRGPDALAWFYVGMPLTVIALLGALVWTVAVLAKVDSPATRPHVTLEITGHQWWWEIRYLSPRPAETFTTANEIHIPTGEPVLIQLIGADVIHSFWIPSLSGKTDAIPGQTNIAWLQTDRRGIYLGQCAEYCGLQHAHMAIRVIAGSPGDYETWRQAQLRPSPAPTDEAALAGQALFVAHCGACHTVRGTPAGGGVGPDLTHLNSRQTLAAGAVANTVGGLSGWIADPQSIKPGARMPATFLSGPQLSAVVAYLETLK
jgi:cytochrome c oxidase subunit 2